MSTLFADTNGARPCLLRKPLVSWRMNLGSLWITCGDGLKNNFSKTTLKSFTIHRRLYNLRCHRSFPFFLLAPPCRPAPRRLPVSGHSGISKAGVQDRPCLHHPCVMTLSWFITWADGQPARAKIHPLGSGWCVTCLFHFLGNSFPKPGDPRAYASIVYRLRHRPSKPGKRVRFPLFAPISTQERWCYGCTAYG